MSVSRRNTRRGRNKPQEETSYSIVTSIKMLGIGFANDISDLVDTTEALTANPTVTLKGTKAIFDYGHLTNQDDIDAINYLFQNVLSADDTVTVSDATHVNPLIGDNDEYDIAGTYTFVKYDPTSKIAILSQVSINNKSLTYERYDYRYFTNSESLKFTTESTQTITEERRIILNLLGAESENSFLLGFRELHVGDILTIQGVKGDFTVLEYRINSKNEEEIIVEEEVPNTELFGESTLVTLKRRVGDENATRLFYPPEDIDPLSRGTCCAHTDESDGKYPGRLGMVCIENVTEKECERDANLVGNGTHRWFSDGPSCSTCPCNNLNINGTRTVQDDEACSERGPGPVPGISPRNRVNSDTTQPTRREPIVGLPAPIPSGTTFRNDRVSRETSKIEQRKEEWLSGPRESVYVRVIKDSKGQNVFQVKGKVTNHKWTRKAHTLVAGQTYRFVQTDRSNKGHPLKFSLTADGTHTRTGNARLLPSVSSNKKPGSSSSHVYFTVPGVLPGERVHLYCANHSGMGMNFEVHEEIYGPSARRGEFGGDDPPTQPGGGTGGLPVGPGEGRDDRKDWINTCCTEKCIECLLDGIREKETGDPCQDGPSGIPEDSPPYCPTCLEDPCDGGGDISSPCYGCNAIKKCDGCPECPPGNTADHQPCCRNNIGPSSPCWSCGPYMIKKEYWDEARRACTGRPNSSSECCSIPANWEGELCKKCEGTAAQIQACCKRKRDLSRLVIRCWWRFYTRNGRCQSGSGNCQGYPNPDGKCWTCKDLAQGHNGGPCRNANTDYWPCRSGGHCGIKKALCNMGGECDDCCEIKATCRGKKSPPLLVPKDKSCCGGDCGQSPDGPATETDSPTNTPTTDMRAFYD